jgi:Tol biopolymer transport system component
MEKHMSTRSGVILGRLAVVAMLVLAACTSNGNGASSADAGSNSTSGPTPTSLGHIVWGYWDDDDNLHVFTANADGTNIQTLLPRLGWVGAPKWSPDGQRLALYVGGSGLAEADQADDVLVTGGIVNADGTGFHAFDSPDRTLNIACFEWSPDGDRLACEGFDDSDPARDGLYTVSATDGGDLRSVTTGHRVALCGYSPDGARIAYLQDDRHLTVVDIDGTNKRRLTDTTFGPGCDWSPDGRAILAVSDGSLIAVGLDGTETQIPVVGDTVSSYGPAYSPEGSSIIFMASTEGELYDIYTMRLDGSEPVQITDTPQEEDFADWGP